jgi:DHA1 family multidrug resistance protein-like MFS transporter
MTSPTPRPGRILALMCVLIAVNQLGFGGIVPALALYARSYGVAQSAIGLAIAVYGLITAAGNLMCALAPTFTALVVARFVAGAGAAMVLTVGQIVLADITVPANRGRVMAIYQGVFTFAVGIGPLPGGYLADRYGLAAPFLFYAVAGVLAAAVAGLFLPETRDLARARSAVEAPPTFVTQLRLLGRHRGFLLVSVLSFVAFFTRTGALFNLVPVLARDRLALDTGRIGFGLALSSLVGLVLAYPAGVLVDRYGRKTVIVPATILTGLSMLLFLLASSYAGFLAGCVAWSVAVGVGGAAPAAYAVDTAPPGMNAAAMSTYRMLADFGYVVGPITLGLAADLLGITAALGITVALLTVVALAFAWWAPETHRGFAT